MIIRKTTHKVFFTSGETSQSHIGATARFPDENRSNGNNRRRQSRSRTPDMSCHFSDWG